MPKASLRIQASIWKRTQDWPFEPSGFYFLAHAAQLLCPDGCDGRQQLAPPLMRRNLADGKFRAAALLNDGTLAAVPPIAWAVDENFNEWFGSCQITNFKLFGRGVHPLAGVTQHWLFIEKAGLDADLGFSETQVEQAEATESEHLDERPASYLRQASVEDIQRQPFLFLGQAIEWIIDRGLPVQSSYVAEKWDAAERELFDFLDAENIKVEGYRADQAPRVYETLPSGIWAKMNRGDDSGLTFSPIDDTEEREDGGSVCVGDLQWEGVRLPTSVVLKHWASADASTVQPKTIGRRPGYDWESFDKVALAKLDEEGAFDPSVDTRWNKAAFERHMATWCRNNWEKEPGESTIRSRLSGIETAYLEGRKGQ